MTKQQPNNTFGPAVREAIESLKTAAAELAAARERIDQFRARKIELSARLAEPRPSGRRPSGRRRRPSMASWRGPPRLMTDAACARIKELVASEAAARELLDRLLAMEERPGPDRL